VTLRHDVNRIHGSVALLALLLTTNLALLAARAEEAPLPPPLVQAPAGPVQPQAPLSLGDARRPHEAIVLPAALGGVLLVGGYVLSLVAYAEATQTVRNCGGAPAAIFIGSCESTLTSRGSDWSFVPIIGPFAAAADGSSAGLSIAAGLSQVAGALTLAVGIPLGIDAMRGRGAAVQLSWSGSQLMVSGRF
jgi:hypothetical protein